MCAPPAPFPNLLHCTAAPLFIHPAACCRPRPTPSYACAPSSACLFRLPLPPAASACHPPSRAAAAGVSRIKYTSSSHILWLPPPTPAARRSRSFSQPLLTAVYPTAQITCRWK